MVLIELLIAETFVKILLKGTSLSEQDKDIIPTKDFLFLSEVYEELP